LNKVLYGRLRSNVFWNIATEVLTKGAVFLGMIYLARTLGVENFGWFAFIQSVVLIIWVFPDVGIGTYGIKAVAQNKNALASIVDPMITMRAGFGAVIFVISGVAILLFSTQEWGFKAAMLAGAFYLLTYTLYPDWLLKGLESFRILAIGGLVYSACFLLGIFWFVQDSQDLWVAMLIWSSSFGVSSVLLFFLLGKLGVQIRLNFDTRLWRQHLGESLYVMLSGFLSATYHQLPIIFLGLILSKAEVGLFSPPFKLVTIASAFGFYIASGVFPIMADLYSKNAREFKYVTNLLTILFLVFGLFIALAMGGFSETIISVLFGSKFLGSAQYLGILVWLVPIQLIRYRYAFHLRATELQKYQFIPFAVVLPMVAGVGIGLFAGGILTIVNICRALVVLDALILVQFILLCRLADGRCK